MVLSTKEQAEKKAIQLKFGRRLAEIRKEHGITQERLSFILKVDRTYISYIERGERNPSLYFIAKTAKKLKVKASDLLNF